MSFDTSDLELSISDAARELLDVLLTGAPNRASLAASRAHELFEALLASEQHERKIACQAGCAFCCHMRVFATAPEVFLVANTLRQEHSTAIALIIAGIESADRVTRGVSDIERLRRREPCALLKDNRCSVYGARPGVCRGLASTSVTACERGFNNLPTLVSTPRPWKLASNAERQALWAALEGTGLSWESYELHHALLIAMQITDAEERWLAGEDVFAGVARMSSANPEHAAASRKVIATVLARVQTTGATQAR